MTLRTRLLAFSALHVGVAALLFTALWLQTRHNTARLYVDFLEQKAVTNLHRATSELGVAMSTNDRLMLAAIAADIPLDEDFLGLALHDSVGVTALANGEAPPQALWTHPALTPITYDSDLWSWNSVTVDGVALGRVALGFKRARLDAFNRTMAWLGVAGVVTLMVGAALALAFARTLVRPLEAMAAFCQRVARGDFDRRLDVRAPGELAALQTDLNVMASGLALRESALLVRQRQLEDSLKLLRETQHEFALATRLAAVGEMAGRTAHEVLNPVTSAQGRLTRMLAQHEQTLQPNVAVLREIVDGQRDAFEREGFAGYVRSLERRVLGPDGAERSMLEEDLENLTGLARLLDTTADQWKRDVEFLVRELDRITHIVDGMRSMSRRTGTHTVLRLREVLTETAEILRDTLEKRKVALELSFESEPVVVADRYELLQILTNLVRNSMHAIEEKAGRAGGLVALSASTREGRAELRVRDTGTGIKPEHLPLVFESTFTTRSSKDGTGLGLSIARRLARQCGGELAVEQTVVGEGTTFLFTLPLHEEPGRPSSPRSGATP